MDDNKYKGRPCGVCEGVVRFKITDRCVPCMKGYRKKSTRKSKDLHWYGASVDNYKTARRRAAEERIDEW